MRQFRYLSIADTVADLQQRGFIFDFILLNSRLFCLQQKIYLDASEFDIPEMYYFPRSKKAPDGKMIYAVDSVQYGIKGILLITCAEKGNIFPEIIYNKLEVYAGKRRPLADNGLF